MASITGGAIRSADFTDGTTDIQAGEITGVVGPMVFAAMATISMYQFLQLVGTGGGVE